MRDAIHSPAWPAVMGRSISRLMLSSITFRSRNSDASSTRSVLVMWPACHRRSAIAAGLLALVDAADGDANESDAAAADAA